MKDAEDRQEVLEKKEEYALRKKLRISKDQAALLRLKIKNNPASEVVAYRDDEKMERHDSEEYFKAPGKA